MRPVLNILESLRGREQETIKKTSRAVLLNMTVGVASVILLVVSLTVDPILCFIKYYTRVTNGSAMHVLLQKELPGLLLSTYLFNITNAERFLAGQDLNLKVQEVGPFSYREYRSHEDIEIDEEAQVLRYTPVIRLEFKPEESVGLPENFNVTMPNLPMLGLASKMSTWTFLAQLPLNVILSNMQSKPVVSMDAKSYLWGYKDPIVTLANNVLPNVFNFDKIGILNQLNAAKNKNRMELSVKDSQKFRIKRINGHKKLKMAEGEDPDFCTNCDPLEDAYEGIGFSPDLQPELPINVFKSGLCRLLPLDFNGKKMTEFGGEAFMYRFSDRFFSSTKERTGEGLVDFSQCFFGLPIVASRAHLQGVNRTLYSRVEGLKPEEQKTGWAVIDPRLGMPLATEASIQMSMVISDVNYNAQAKSFSNMVVPIGYLKIIQSTLPEDIQANLRLVHTIAPIILITVQVLLSLTIIFNIGYLIRHALVTNDLVSKNVKYGMVFPKALVEKHVNEAYVEEPLLEMSEMYAR